MRKQLLTLALLLIAATTFAQSGIRYFQLKDLPSGHIIIDQGSGNTNALLNATLVPTTIQNGVTGATVQAEMEAIRAALASGGDAWGAQVVASGTSLSGDGTSGSPLNVVPGNILTSTLNNDAGFLTTEVDGSITNEIQDLVLTGDVLSINGGGAGSVDLSNYLGTDDQNLILTGNTLTIQNGTGSVDLSNYIDDADASVTNEAQAITQSGNIATLAAAGGAGGGTVNVADVIVDGAYTATGGETSYSIPSAVGGTTRTRLFYRNGVRQIIGTDITISSTTVTIVGTAAEAAEVFSWNYIAQ